MTDLAMLNDNVVWLTCEPEILDFTKPFKGQIQISGRTHTISVTLPDDNLHSVFSTIRMWLEGKTIVTWDIKRLITYLKHRLPANYDLSLERIHDLKLLEAFNGIHEKMPKTYVEAGTRFLKASTGPAKSIHSVIHLPLATRVIPGIEVVGLASKATRTRVYTSYDIEGQVHGRMSSHKQGENFFVPHNMGDEQRKNLCCPFEKKFMYLDYKHMEVTVLQNLSGDEKLGEIIKSGEDLYSEIYHLVSKAKADKEKRDLIKKAMLPIIFGAQSRALAENLELTEKGARHLRDAICALFPTAFQWLDEKQEEARDKPITDHFGRQRDCREQPWIARNLCVQAPAATICLEKLIELYDQVHHMAPIAMSIHDGYVLLPDIREIEFVAIKAKDVLESPSQLIPGLQMRVDCKAGSNLEELNDYKL